jgi:hypothetical protein
VHRRDTLELALEQWIFVHEGKMATLSVTCEVADFDLVHPIGATIADELRLR